MGVPSENVVFVISTLIKGKEWLGTLRQMSWRFFSAVVARQIIKSFRGNFVY